MHIVHGKTVQDKNSASQYRLYVYITYVYILKEIAPLSTPLEQRFINSSIKMCLEQC